MVMLAVLGMAVSLVPSALACFLADLARWTITRRAIASDRCSSCGYSLAGLPQPDPTCPECGTPAARHSALQRLLPWACMVWPLALGPAGVVAYILISPDPMAERVVLLLLWLTWPYGLAVAVLAGAGWRRLPRLTPMLLIACALFTATIQVSELSGAFRGVSADPAFKFDYEFNVALPVMSVLLVLGNCVVIAAVSLASFLPARFWPWLVPRD